MRNSYYTVVLILACCRPCIGQDTTYNSVIHQLQFIDERDQQYRNQMDYVQDKFGGDSDEMRQLMENMKRADDQNLAEVKIILEQYGWLNENTVGYQANTAIFMVIQHADLKDQLYFLPIMREAVKQGNAKPNHYAMLEDRVLLLTGQKQKYGSQISWNMKTDTRYVAPLEDPDHVDKRRLEVGLPPLAAYLSEMDMVWDVEQYKKDLPSLEILFFKP